MSVISNNKPFTTALSSDLQTLNIYKKPAPKEENTSDFNDLFSSDTPTIVERERHISDYERGEGYRSRQIGDKIAKNKIKAIFDLNPDDLADFSGYQTALGYAGRVNLSEATRSVTKALKKIY